MKIVIKVGTQSILAADGTLLETAISSLVAQIAALAKDGHDVALVSSGAVGSGRRIARVQLNQAFGASTAEKQMLASLGQPALMQTYSRLFEPYGLAPAQLLLTKQDFQTRHHYLNIARLLREILTHKNIIPVINENDSVSVQELMFTDNDELAGLIAAQMNADRLIILTGVAGVYDGHPNDAESRVIPVINPAKTGWPQAFAVKTALGRGGMTSKLGTARKMSGLGITTHIAALGEKDVILRIVASEPVGTVILPARKKSNIKKWIAFHDERKNGAVHVNAPLLEILKENRRIISLLPVGIVKCAGDFQKGDVIDIAAPNGRRIGVGIARYGADRLREYIGVKGKPAIVHYDHLHINAEDLS